VVVDQRGQGTVEWVGLVAVVAMLLVGLLAAGVRIPGAALAQAVASRLLCAAALADRCGDEPALIAAYGSDVGRLVREHMPSLFFEEGSRALPVDFRRCRSPRCGDGTARGRVVATDAGLPVTAFVHVVDCREAEGATAATASAGGSAASAVPDCAGPGAGNLYLQYWLYYADSATLRGVPFAEAAGYHLDDWESVQIRIEPDGSVDERASSHHGYNYAQGVANAGSDVGSGPLTAAGEAFGARPRGGWGPETGMLLVSGGSHAGNAKGFPRFDRVAPAGRIHLIPLEPIVAEADAYRFAIGPPWRKQVWTDPEATGTE
jgi:hypothetical protein